MDLITDRTQSDVNYARMMRSANGAVPLKGAYNAADYNRVGAALNYLSDIIYQYGYGHNPSLRTDWDVTEIFTPEDGKHYLSVMRKLKESYFTLFDTPELPDNIQRLFELGGHERANDIEKLLFDIEKITVWMVNSFFYSNQFYSGENIEIAGFRFTVRRPWSELQKLTWKELQTQSWYTIQFG